MAADSGNRRAEPKEREGGTDTRLALILAAERIFSEEGISKGVRRIVGVTGQEAKDAIAAGKALKERMESALALDPKDIGELHTQLKIEIDAAVISATTKGELRKQHDLLVNKVQELLALLRRLFPDHLQTRHVLVAVGLPFLFLRPAQRTGRALRDEPAHSGLLEVEVVFHSDGKKETWGA